MEDNRVLKLARSALETVEEPKASPETEKKVVTAADRVATVKKVTNEHRYMKFDFDKSDCFSGAKPDGSAINAATQDAIRSTQEALENEIESPK